VSKRKERQEQERKGRKEKKGRDWEKTPPK